MQLKHFLYGLIFAFTLSSTCALAQDSSMNANQNNQSNEQMQEDHNAIVVLSTIDQNEVNAAKEALKKSKNSLVKNFAKQMEKDHATNRSMTLKIAHKIKANTSPTDESKELMEKGKKQLSDLSTLNGKQFDEQYMDTMVKDHKEALDLVQGLSSKVTNTELKDHLVKTANAIEQHLQKAKEVQSQLASA